MKIFYQVIKFGESQSAHYFKERVDAWDYMHDYVKQIGYEPDEIQWLKGLRGVLGVDIVGMEKVIGIMELEFENA